MGGEENLRETIEKLQNENSRLKSRPRGRFGYFFIIIGFILVSLAIDFSNYILAFFSLAFIFLGGLFLYINPNNYVRQDILLSALSEINSFHSEFLPTLNYSGSEIYSPSESLEEFPDVYLYISMSIDHSSVLEHQQGGENAITEQRLKIKPIGLSLTKLMEREAKINFASIDIDYLFAILEKMLVENLELVKNIILTKDENIINIKIKHQDELITQSEPAYSTYIIGSIACAITKSINKPLIIKDVIKESNNIDEIIMQII